MPRLHVGKNSVSVLLPETGGNLGCLRLRPLKRLNNGELEEWESLLFRTPSAPVTL